MSIRKKLQKIADEQFEQENIENEKKLKNGEAQILLNNVLNSANSMIEQLKLFVESVNELNKNNTDVYNELKKMVKLPDEQQIAELKTEFNENVNNLFDFYWKIPSSFGSNPSKIGIQSSAVAV